MRRRFFSSVIIFWAALVLTIQTDTTAFAVESAFKDVPADSRWCESINYIADKGITQGTGINTFSPDAPVTVRQWAVMLCRAYCGENIPDDTAEPFGEPYLSYAYQKGWVLLGAATEPDTNYCRSAIYESIFNAAGIHIYDYELYDSGKYISPTENYIRVAAEIGLCCEAADPSEIITRGEAAFIIHMMLTNDAKPSAPEILRELSIKNPSSVNLNDFLQELKLIPKPILQAFRESGWVYAVDFEYMEEFSKDYGMICIGATSYHEQHIYVSEAGATLHEFGHFLDGALGFPSLNTAIYEEADEADFLHSYAKTNHYEYFAEYFAYWLTNCGDSEKSAQMEKLTPQTYLFFRELAESNYGFDSR